ncbi:MAG: hypothetical protein ABR887_00485 [Methanoregulaceae archaeon]
MKEEDIDWFIYHLIVQKDSTTLEDLTVQSQLDSSTVLTSLIRLEKKNLIDFNEGKIRVLSIGDSLIKCQAVYDPNLQYIVENGIIKTKKKE